MRWLVVVVVVTALWIAPYIVTHPARPEPDAETRVALLMGDDEDAES